MNQANEANPGAGAGVLTRAEADRQYEQVLAFFEKREPELPTPKPARRK